MLMQVGVVLATLASFWYARTPWSQASVPPTSQWADEPMKLITTPTFKTHRDDIFTAGATHMCLAHNVIIRGFNSIYLQAEHIQKKDKRDFVNYALTWYRFVASHHQDEEENLFPLVEQVLDDKTIWKETHKEHDSFMAGLEQYYTYLDSLETASSFSGSELVRIMDSFRHPFEHHFHHEIEIISAFRNHPRAPIAGTEAARNASLVFTQWGKKTVGKAGLLDAVPFFLMNLDATAEGGMWRNWPPMPKPVRLGLVNGVGTLFGRWWRFSSSDYQGQPRQLYALRQK